MNRILSIFILVGLAACASSQPAGEKTTDQYIADLSSGDTALQIDAARKLGMRKDEKAVPALVQLLDSNPGPDVSWNAAAALGAIGKAGPATSALTKSVSSSSSNVVKYASVAGLANLRDADKKAEVVQAVKSAADTNDDLLRDLATRVADLLAK
ncbi:MAG: HEAT repeat domain-containing protein [Spirochaetia bacterium]|nr:HEAT repeat domain-containing protein [Spirochaetia bacterium]